MSPPHRLTTSKPDEENAIIQFIETGHANGIFVTQMDIFTFGAGEFGKCLAYGWISNFLVRHADRGCRAVASPQEKPRLAILPLFSITLWL
jgi:hypothetical protein